MTLIIVCLSPIRPSGSDACNPGVPGAGAVGEQLAGMKITELGELGKQAGVLGKQAASNIKKGFGQFVAGAKELSAKAQAEISKRSNKGSGGLGAGPEQQPGRVVGKPATHPVAGQAGTTLAQDDEPELL